MPPHNHLTTPPSPFKRLLLSMTCGPFHLTKRCVCGELLVCDKRWTQYWLHCGYCGPNTPAQTPTCGHCQEVYILYLCVCVCVRMCVCVCLCSNFNGWLKGQRFDSLKSCWCMCVLVRFFLRLYICLGYRYVLYANFFVSSLDAWSKQD